MSYKELAIQLINNMPDYKLGYAIAYLQGLVADESADDLYCAGLLDEYKNEREKTCKECWASKICSLCFRDLMDKNGVINKKRAADLCSKERDSIQRTLIEYCTIMESDSSLLEHLNQYIVQF